MKNVIFMVVMLVVQVIFAAPNVSSLSAGSDILWTPLGPSGGGYYEAVTFSPANPDMICIGTDVGGFFISFDRGQTFEARTKGLNDYFIERIAIHPTNNDIIILAAAGGIFRTTDRGMNWTWIRSGFPAASTSSYSAPMNVVCFDPQNPATIFAGQGRTRGDLNNGGTKSGNIYKSTDTGQTWTLVSFGQTNTNAIINDIIVKPDNSNIILASSDYGMYRSIDGGITWSAANTGLTNLSIRKIAFSQSSPNTVYITVNTTARDSQTWNGGIYKSTDAGLSWTNVSGNFPQTVGPSSGSDQLTTSPKDIIVHPTAPNTVYVANFSWISRGIYKTTTGGQTWSNTTTSSNVTLGWAHTQIGAPFCLAMYPGNPDLIFSGDSMQLYLTENGGVSWVQKYCEMLPDGSFKGNGADVLCVEDIIFDINNPDRIYFCNMDKGLLITDNKGESYHSSNIDGHVYTIAVDAEKTPRVIWAAANFTPKLRKSTDDGTTWSSCINGLPTNMGDVHTIIMDTSSDVNNRRLLVTVNGYGVYESLDGGSSWSSINGNLPATASGTPCGLLWDPQDSQHIIVALGGDPANGAGIYETQNGGNQWQQINTTSIFYDIQALRADPKDFNILFIAQRYKYINNTSYSGGVFQSTNGGYDWSLILEGTFCSDIIINPVDSETLYATFKSLPYHDNSVGEGVIKSSDRGKSWQTEWNGLSNFNVSIMKINPHNPEEIYIGTAGASSFMGLDRCLTPLIHWKLDEENSSLTALDSSGFAHNGDITGNGDRITGVVGNAIKLQNGEKISYKPPTNSVNRRKGVTISTWSNLLVKGTQTNSYVMRKINSYYLKQAWSGSIEFTVYVNGTAYSMQGYYPVTENQWYHIAGTYSDQTKSMKLYIDGVCVEEYTLPVGLSSYLIDDNDNDIDTFVSGVGTTRVIAYDDIRLYNYSVSEYDIKKLADSEMILNINFEDSEDSSIIVDDSIYGCEGSVNSYVYPVMGVKGKALAFEGNNKIDISSASLQLSRDALTVCGWIYIAQDGYQDNSNIFSKYKTFSLVSGWGRNTTFNIYIDGTAHSTTSYNLSAMTWHHVAGTYSSTNKELCIYIDGVLKETKTLSGLSNYQIDVTSYSGTIGVNGNDSRISYFDDVRIYSRILTGEEISSLSSEGN